MKLFRTLITAGILLTIPVALQAQLSEQSGARVKGKAYGQVKTIGVAKASMEYYERAADTLFVLILQDERKELNSFFSVRFSSRDNTLQRLYDALCSFFEKENWQDKDYIRTFTLGETKVTVYRATGLLPQKAIIFSTDKGRTRLGRNEINQLFNR